MSDNEVVCFVIDDDRDDLESFQLAINSVDSTIRCIKAHSGDAGLKILDALPVAPNYIFLDLNMPGMDGWECLREIKKRPHLKNVPVIILSTAQCLKDRGELSQLEIARYIVKPPKLAELTQAISKVFIREIIL